MKPEYKQVNQLWCYSFNTEELFTVPATDVPSKPAFLFDVYPEVKLSDLSRTHSVHAISFWSCESEDTLRGYLSGVLPAYHMYEIYGKFRRCVIVAEGAENIYVDVKKSWMPHETPYDVMIRMTSSGRLVRTMRSKVLVFDPMLCDNV